MLNACPEAATMIIYTNNDGQAVRVVAGQT